MFGNLPLKEPRPDAARFIDALTGKVQPGAPPLVEYLVDDLVMQPVVEDLLEADWVPQSTAVLKPDRDTKSDRDTQKRHLDMFIEFWHRLGYDIVRFERGLHFPENKLDTDDTARGSNKQRAWADEHRGSIMNRKDFDSYPWPKLEEVDFFPFEYIDSHLPDGMGMVTCHAAGIFEHLSWIMSYEGLALSLYDDPDLVKDVADRIGTLMLGFYRHLLDLDHVVAIFPGDDMGFKTGTLVSPEALREYCLVWHRKIAALVHEKELPYFLHSCGDLSAILDDLIDDVKIDGKHSYENTIMPVDEFQRQYGHRIAVLGGLDLNILSRASPDEVRVQTRGLMETCGARGRYAVGSGNSIPSYIPVENYLSMVDEAVTARMAHGEL